MINSKTLVIASVLCFTLILSFFAKAQTSVFEQYNLKYGISIEVPKHWIIIDKQVMNQIDTNTELTTGVSQGDNDIVLAANYIANDQILATVRVSVRIRNTFTQEAIKSMSQSEIDKQDVSSRAMVLKSLEGMNNKLTHISEYKTTKEILSGFLAMRTDYQTIESSKTMNTSIYVIYLGNKAVKMTLSYEERNTSLLKPTIERIKKSFVLKIR